MPNRSLNEIFTGSHANRIRTVDTSTTETEQPISYEYTSSTDYNLNDLEEVDEIVDREVICHEEIQKVNDNSIFNKEDIKQCFICGKDVKFCNASGIYYCEECLKKFFQKCDKCGMYYDKFDIHHVNSRNLCHNCLSREGYAFCKHCRTWKKNYTIVDNDGIYCKKCLEETDCFICTSCGRTYHRDRYGKDNNCVNCTNARLTEVRNYSYKPDPRFFRKANVNEENLYFGIELEMGNVETPDIVNDFVAEYSNSFFYMKKDTSIPVYGCEIVTQPATLSKHIDSRYWKTMLSVAKDYGFSSDNDKCGIHIHISRNYFNNYEIAKLDCFVNTYDIFKKIARRESHYSEYVNKNINSWGSQITNRKCALNLSNSQTVEMRIFKGTLEYKYVMAYIEFCHAISVFVKAISMDEIINSKQTTLIKFQKLIECDKYKYINEYCKKFKVFE